MTTDWKNLEKFVSQLEELLSHEGVNIRHSEIFTYPDGKQMAQVDITMRLKGGSTHILIGIECRLRPSDGPQGTDWINEVAGKKKLIGAHHMLAVSGTGFTETAIRAAEIHEVELRTLENMNFDLVKDWFRPMIFTMSQVVWEYREEPIIASIPQRSILSTHQCLEIDAKTLSLNDLISRDVTKLVGENRIRVPEATVVEYLYKNTQGIKAILDRELLLVTRIEVPLLISLRLIRPQLILNLYRDPKTSITHVVGRCTVELKEEKFKLLFTAEQSSENPDAFIRVKGRFLTMDDKPYNTHGMRLQLIGYKRGSNS